MEKLEKKEGSEKGEKSVKGKRGKMGVLVEWIYWIEKSAAEVGDGVLWLERKLRSKVRVGNNDLGVGVACEESG